LRRDLFELPWPEFDSDCKGAADFSEEVEEASLRLTDAFPSYGAFGESSAFGADRPAGAGFWDPFETELLFLLSPEDRLPLDLLCAHLFHPGVAKETILLSVARNGGFREWRGRLREFRRIRAVVFAVESVRDRIGRIIEVEALAWRGVEELQLIPRRTSGGCPNDAV